MKTSTTSEQVSTWKSGKKFYIGKNQHERIYLSAPSWDCGWYWGFGYLGNKNCHYHVSSMNFNKNQNLFDAFKEHFGSSLVITKDADLWTLCELFKSFYILKESAEFYGKGSAHYTTNPLADLLKNEAETERINKVLLPAIFDEIYKILNKY